jgi:hypothetical protein
MNVEDYLLKVPESVVSSEESAYFTDGAEPKAKLDCGFGGT